MKIRITLEQLIVSNIFLFVVSFFVMKFSDIFRLNYNLHWIYSFAHVWWLLFAWPFTMILSVINAIRSFIKINKKKYFWILISLLPILFFLILQYIYVYVNLFVKFLWRIFF